jgi:hypothetical protein
LFTGASGAFLKEVWHNNGYKTSPSRATTLDTIMLWPYPLVTFRADNSEFDFDKLSVREIAPPAP